MTAEQLRNEVMRLRSKNPQLRCGQAIVVALSRLGFNVDSLGFDDCFYDDSKINGAIAQVAKQFPNSGFGEVEGTYYYCYAQ